MSPVHLPNATGGGQSVYAVKQLQRVTPSPSPSRGAKGTGGRQVCIDVLRSKAAHPVHPVRASMAAWGLQCLVGVSGLNLGGRIPSPLFPLQ